MKFNDHMAVAIATYVTEHPESADFQTVAYQFGMTTETLREHAVEICYALEEPIIRHDDEGFIVEPSMWYFRCGDGSAKVIQAHSLSEAKETAGDWRFFDLIKGNVFSGWGQTPEEKVRWLSDEELDSLIMAAKAERRLRENRKRFQSDLNFVVEAARQAGFILTNKETCEILSDVEFV